jgi:hypothetical protein
MGENATGSRKARVREFRLSDRRQIESPASDLSAAHFEAPSLVFTDSGALRRASLSGEQ